MFVKLKSLEFFSLLCVFTLLCCVPPVHAASITSYVGVMENGSSEIKLTLNSRGSYIRKQVYIDTDNISATGFDSGYDILLEDGNLYEYTGTGSNWSWDSIGTASGPVGVIQDNTSWVVSESVIGSVVSGARLNFAVQATPGDVSEESSLLLAATSNNIFSPSNNNSNFANPERGLYHYTIIRPDGAGGYIWDGADAATLRALGKSLVLIIVDLKEERNSVSLPTSLLDTLDTTLQYLSQNGLKAVFRGRYKTDEGPNDGCPGDPQYEPASVTTILDHIGDLAGIINSNPGSIAYIETGMIGRWGEWNCSVHDINDPQLALDVTGEWLQQVPGKFAGLRRPRFKADAGFNANQLTGVSHYNDCFLFNAGHAGTYDPGVTMSTVAEYRDYLQGHTMYGETEAVLMGGESCGISSSYPGSSDTYAPVTGVSGDYCAKGQLALEEYRYTYLSSWETAWPVKWIEQQCWTDIQKELGYRFDLESVELPVELNSGSTTLLTMTVNNEGYARYYNDRVIELVYLNNGNEINSSVLEGVSPSSWIPGVTTVSAPFAVPADLAQGTYDVGLRIPDSELPSEPLSAIRFANAGWQSGSGVQVFGTVLVTPAPLCNGLPITVNLSAGDMPTSGDDVILGTSSGDTINALGGNDTICGLGGQDNINGGRGEDWIDAGVGNDIVQGANDADEIYGDTGNDTLFGGPGDDKIFGEQGDDFIKGNSDDDTLDGGSGIDKIQGGSGNDTIYTGTGSNVGTDQTVTGGNGDDIIYGGLDADTLRGEAGTDTIRGGDGDDQLYGGGGADFIYGEGGNDLVRGNAAADALYGGPGDDQVDGLGGADLMYGGSGSDTMSGSTGDDVIYGEAGDDILNGGGGNDLLNGGADTDDCDGAGANGDAAVDCEIQINIP